MSSDKQYKSMFERWKKELKKVRVRDNIKYNYLKKIAYKRWIIKSYLSNI